MTAQRHGLTLPLAAAVLALLCTNAPPLRAGQGGAGTVIVSKTDVGNVTLSAEEEAVIRSYFAVNAGALDDLRPLSQGVRNKLTPGATLPLINTRRPLPAALDSRLPPRQGLDYLVLGGDIVLFDIASHRIVAVLKDVRRGS